MRIGPWHVPCQPETSTQDLCYVQLYLSLTDMMSGPTQGGNSDCKQRPAGFQPSALHLFNFQTGDFS